MISIRSRRSWWRLSYFTAFLRDFRDASLYPLSSDASCSRSVSCPRSASSHSAFGRHPGSATAPVWSSFLSGRHAEHDRTTLCVGDGVQLCVHAAFGPTDLAAALLFFARRLQAVRCVFRWVASIMSVLRSAPSDARSIMTRAKGPAVAQTFPATVRRVLAKPYPLGALHHRKPWRLMKMMPVSTRRSSTRGRPWFLGNQGRRRSICPSVSQ